MGCVGWAETGRPWEWGVDRGLECRPLQPTWKGKASGSGGHGSLLISSSCGEELYNGCVAPCTVWALINTKWKDAEC